jgi:hypothetical protein
MRAPQEEGMDDDDNKDSDNDNDDDKDDDDDNDTWERPRCRGMSVAERQAVVICQGRMVA